MMEMSKKDVFLTYLDQILAGAKNVGPVEDEEIAKLLELAQTMVEAGCNINSEIRETLREQILNQVSHKDKALLSLLGREYKLLDCELDEEDLEYVAAGLTKPIKDEI